MTDKIILAVALIIALWYMVSEIYVRLQGILFVKTMETVLMEDAQSY